METEVEYKRFLSLVLLFLSSIFLFIFASNLVWLLVGWDLLGFSSFFLVSYFGNKRSHSAALLTALSNRFGDCFFFILIALSACSSRCSSLIVTCFIILVSMTKRAQFPFAAWLPAAMYAPTPVRALVHSSTLVTAGVYLLFRICTPEVNFLFNLGIITSLIRGLAAVAERDIKKVVALSTLSQLGIIMCGLGLGLKVLTFNHMLAHAPIKALLFLCIGVIIHTSYGSQDARLGLSLFRRRAFILVSFTLSALGLGGIVFMSGYFTKDALLEAGFMSTLGICQLFLFYASLGLTISYLARLYYCLVSYSKSNDVLVASARSTWFQKVPIIFLLLTLFLQACHYAMSRPPTSVVLGAWDSLLFLVFAISGGLLG